MFSSKSCIINLLMPILLLPFLGVPAQAHPHAFADTSYLVSFDNNGLAAIRVRWVFDEMFSCLLLDEFEKNHDGKLSPGEVKALESEAFTYLSNFSYLTLIKIQGREFKIKEVKDFQAWTTDGKLVYQFVIPCPVDAAKMIKNLVLCPYDTTNYTCLSLIPDNAVQLKTTPQIEARVMMTMTQVANDMLGEVDTTGVCIQFWRKQ